jgi:hypothetical protein
VYFYLRRRGRGEEGRSSGYKLNTTNGFIDKIILSSMPLVILSIKNVTSLYNLPFESHYKIIYNSVGIYGEIIFIGIFTNKLYRRGLKPLVKVTHHHTWFDFRILDFFGLMDWFLNVLRVIIRCFWVAIS